MICLLLLDLKQEIQVHKIPMKRFYEYFGITRQGYRKKLAKFHDNQLVVKKIREEVKTYRTNIDRRAGSRSLYYNLEIKRRYDFGVNKFERLMSKVGMTLIPMRINVVTTQSCYQSWNYKNLINGLILNGINQVIVGDITYLYLFKSRYYLFCLIDIFSNRIVGHCLSKRMRSLEALAALEKCVNLRGAKNLLNCIHHTDGGKQYFSEIYLNLTDKMEMRNSAAKTCLENGYAEQKNGFIKSHLIPTMDLINEKIIAKELDVVIHRYNNDRKQESLGWLSPSQFEKRLQDENYKPTLQLHDHVKNRKGGRKGF